MARHMRLSGLSASRPSSLRRSGWVLGNSATQGMPKATASFARATIPSTDQRETPGRLAIGFSTACPSVTNRGQMKSAGVSTISRCMARLQPVARVRRRRSAGKGAVMVAVIASGLDHFRASCKKVGTGFLQKRCDHKNLDGVRDASRTPVEGYSAATDAASRRSFSRRRSALA